MNAEDINSIITGTVSTTPGPIGGPSNTPAPWGINDPSATTQPGSGTGAPTPMPKQDSAHLIGTFGIDLHNARQSMHEARARLEASDTILNRVAAELAAIERNPPDRQVRFNQEAFFPMLLAIIDAAKRELSSQPNPNLNAINLLTQAEWIAGKIRQL